MFFISVSTKSFRNGNLPSSTTISSVEKLFENQPLFLNSFKHLFPENHSAAVSSCVDFVNLIRDSGAYWRFMGCIESYASGEITADAVSDRVSGYFGHRPEIIKKFMGFLPESCRSWKRKLGDDDRDRSTPDYGMDDWLADIDVKIAKLESVRRKALKIAGGFRRGLISPETDIRIDEDFTELDYAFLRKMDRKIVEVMDQELVIELGKLMEFLERKKAIFEYERLKIVQNWDKIRISSKRRVWSKRADL